MLGFQVKSDSTSPFIAFETGDVYLKRKDAPCRSGGRALVAFVGIGWRFVLAANEAAHPDRDATSQPIGEPTCDGGMGLVRWHYFPTRSDEDTTIEHNPLDDQQG